VRPRHAEKLISSWTSSASRIASDTGGAAAALRTREVSESVGRAVKPRSLSGGMKKLGIALVATPDPITGVPGAALLASSFVMKRREPVGASQLAKEARKILREMESLRI
jgi:hypothetical protein